MIVNKYQPNNQMAVAANPAPVSHSVPSNPLIPYPAHPRNMNTININSNSINSKPASEQ